MKKSTLIFNQIKFRAWSEKLQKFLIQSEREVVDHENGIFVLDNNGFDCVIQRFTGLTDSRGQEIFEGDILKSVVVKSDSKLTETVIFEDGNFCIRPNYENTFHRSNLTLNQKLIENFQYQVIGNIFENPNILNPPESRG